LRRSVRLPVSPFEIETGMSGEIALTDSLKDESTRVSVTLTVLND